MFAVQDDKDEDEEDEDEEDDEMARKDSGIIITELNHDGSEKVVSDVSHHSVSRHPAQSLPAGCCSAVGLHALHWRLLNAKMLYAEAEHAALTGICCTPLQAYKQAWLCIVLAALHILRKQEAKSLGDLL